ncbi:hypothetical protein PY092_17960 [Muricauda sp. 334s03]|uniref:Porin n=1 Tax=Flagellimonas yonaguniensis TaxID=3031325 RepID=A0ABT5Y3N3_9FLAO|nr:MULTISPECIES: hypothetical protein [Allomuricauda]MEC7772141.1 hypothetical protein [Bacteroidota bacterium]MAU14174.1 hypothetical protein [Allomuricauda sp.]MBA4744570.1 hypothetical protein [Allomuricauda sp.]MDF0718054.1 hypothetical protein [[Muricauda] yonaguniensis]NDV17581.1 hypothetical protein [Muricauda sp. TY007]|tara:strand:- start:231 stop:1454 length:1224 start_codon:yes stop_codon:yes gene_type:complete
MKHLITKLLLLFATALQAQIDSTLIKRAQLDTTKQGLNMDAVYDRPFLSFGKVPVSVGGYVEANWQHLGTDGVSEGHQFQMRRMTLFVSSSIGKKLKFLSELEFEEGGKEIAIEFASLDVEFHPLLNLRGGIIMNPIGAFNQNHDGPKWEFTDRPIPATQMLPATWSNAGFGLFGKTYRKDWMFGYELYLSGGFDNSIIDNSENKTFLPAAKENGERFEESASGTPLTTAKIAIRHNTFGEIGLSYMGGIYNTFEDDGIELDKKRRVNVYAIDYNNTLPKLNTYLTGEWAWVQVDIPNTYTQQYGSKQHGGFLDIVQPVLDRKMLGWDNATLNLACRFEYVDWNVGTFNETGDEIGDEIWSIMPAISFRPSPQTVFRLNYRIQRQKDILNNEPARTGGFIFGISSYF